MPPPLSLLSLNCFGTPVPTTRRRLKALAHHLENSTLQLVCLQEVQLAAYQNMVFRACASYPFQAYEPHLHCPKGGLVTLSREPLAAQHFETYAEQGRWYLPTAMDRFLRKGMLITTMQWGEVPLIVINTHIVANYSGNWERHGVYTRMQEKQLRQLADAIAQQPSHALVAVVGDFNLPRGSVLYRDFVQQTGLIDALAGDSRPTHRPPPGVPAHYSLPIDFVFVRVPSSISLQVTGDLRFASKLNLTRKHLDYLSDHNAVEVGFTLHASIKAASTVTHQN